MNWLPRGEKMPLSKWPPAILILSVLFFSSCATAPVAIEKGSAIAVWDLENMTPGQQALPDLGELLSSTIIETINSSGDYTVVEREKLLLTLEELNLGASELVDDSTRLKVGAMLGARVMIFGGYQVIGDMMRIDLRMIETETGRLIKAGQKTATAADIAAGLAGAEELTHELFNTGGS